MPVASSEAVCVPFLCPMEGVYHGRAAAQKKTDRNLQPVSCWDLCAPLLKYAVCKVYSLVFFLVNNFSIYLCS